MDSMKRVSWKSMCGDCPATNSIMHNENHPGFQAEAAKISAKEGVSSNAAGAILASASRNASKAAKKANPALKRVK